MSKHTRQGRVNLEVKKQLEALGLDKAKHMLVKTCALCPFLGASLDDAEYLCNIGDDGMAQGEVPPHNCPLREQAVAVALDPKV